MEKLYYNVELEFANSDNDLPTLTGNKTITGYVINDKSDLAKLFSIHTECYESNTEEIVEYLKEKNLHKKGYNLIRL